MSFKKDRVIIYSGIFSWAAFFVSLSDHGGMVLKGFVSTEVQNYSLVLSIALGLTCGSIYIFQEYKDHGNFLKPFMACTSFCIPLSLLILLVFKQW